MDRTTLRCKVTLLPRECLCSYDVTALFTSVPINPPLNILRELLEQDTILWDRTVLSVQNIIELLGVCLHNNTLLLKITSIEQVECVAKGLPASPIVANLYMEDFEKKALRTASSPLGIGLGLWMTLLLSNIRPINKYFWTILII